MANIVSSSMPFWPEQHQPDAKLIFCTAEDILLTSDLGNSNGMDSNPVNGGGKFPPLSSASEHVCHLCNVSFSSANDYGAHLRSHGRGQSSFPCPFCRTHDVRLPSTTKLWQHIAKTHLSGAVRPSAFLCTLCNREFKQSCNYHQHMLIHIGEQPERCRFCAKAFRTKPSLRKHEMIHTGEKPFSCESCGNVYRTRDELKQHAISHRTEKLYECIHCKGQFKYQASLKRHEKKGRCKVMAKMIQQQQQLQAQQQQIKLLPQQPVVQQQVTTQWRPVGPPKRKDSVASSTASSEEGGLTLSPMSPMSLSSEEEFDWSDWLDDESTGDSVSVKDALYRDVFLGSNADSFGSVALATSQGSWESPIFSF